MANASSLYYGAAGLYSGEVGLIKPSMILSWGTGLAAATSSGGSPPPPPPPAAFGQLDYTDANQSAWSWFF